MALDLRLYALVDPERAGGHDASRAREARSPQGGATLVQLRDKHGDDARDDRERARDQGGARAASACRC